MNIFTKATIYYTRAVAEEVKHNKAFSTQVCLLYADFTARTGEIHQQKIQLLMKMP